MTYYRRESWKKRFRYLAAPYKVRVIAMRRGRLSIWRVSAVANLHVRDSMDHALGICDIDITCPETRVPVMIEQLKQDAKTATRKRLPILFSRRRPSRAIDD